MAERREARQLEKPKKKARKGAAAEEEPGVRGTTRSTPGLRRSTSSRASSTRSRSTCATRSRRRRSACMSTRDGSTRRPPPLRHTHGMLSDGILKIQLYAPTHRQEDVRRNHLAVQPAVRRICSFDDVPEQPTAQRALLKRLDKKQALVYDDMNLPIAIRMSSEKLRVSASLLELWPTCVVVDRVPLKAIPDCVFRKITSLINQSPPRASHAAPNSSRTTQSLTTPTRPASSPTTSHQPPSDAGRSSTSSSSPSRGASPRPSHASTSRWSQR